MASQVPPTLKAIGSYVKIANDNATRDPVIYYWCLFYAVQHAMKIDKTSKEALQFITGILNTLETVKKQFSTYEAITTEIVAQAHVESYALKLFNFADKKEKSGQVDKATVHAFYTAGHLMDVLSLFGELDENIASMKKYAKWKATQINQCIRDGTPYVPSSQPSNDQDFNLPPTQEGGSFPPQQGYGSDSSFGSHNQFNQPPAHGVAPYPPDVPEVNYGNQYPSNGPSSSSRAPQPTEYQPQAPPSGRQPTSEDFGECRKFIKYALSAVDYEDTNAIVDNLKKALAVLQ